MVHALRPGLNSGKPEFDSGIWEPDDEMFAAQEGTIQYLFLCMRTHSLDSDIKTIYLNNKRVFLQRKIWIAERQIIVFLIVTFS